MAAARNMKLPEEKPLKGELDLNSGRKMGQEYDNTQADTNSEMFSHGVKQPLGSHQGKRNRAGQYFSAATDQVAGVPKTAQQDKRSENLDRVHGRNKVGHAAKTFGSSFATSVNERRDIASSASPEPTYVDSAQEQKAMILPQGHFLRVQHEEAPVFHQ